MPQVNFRMGARINQESVTILNEMEIAALLTFVQNGKVAEAVSVVEADPDSLAASNVFIELSKRTYRELRDVSAMVAIGNAGIDFSLAQAASSQNSADSDQFRRNAKVLAYNTAANCWPGWGDPGIEIKKEHLEAGLRLSRICRGLTVELNLGHKERGTAHWLIGALHLAMGHHSECLGELQRAKDEYQAAGHSDLVLLAEGYAALAQKAQPESRSTGVRELEDVLLRLGNQNSKEAQFFAKQLTTADRVLISNL